MRTDLFDFTLPDDRIALRPASPRDAARLLVVRPSAPAELEDHTMRDLPALLVPGDALVVNDTKVFPANLNGRRLGRGEHEPAIAATLVRRLDGSRWRALVKPGKRLAVGDTVRFGGEGRVCFLEQLDATVEEKGEGEQGGEVTFAFAFDGAVLDQALAERGDMPLPPYIAQPPRRRRARPQRLPDHVRARGRLGRGADGGTAFHRKSAAELASARRCAASGDAACRAGHVPAGEGRRHVRPPHACRNGAASAPRPRRRSTPRGAPAAASSPSARPRCGFSKARRREDGTLAPFSGETALFITPGYRFRAVDAMLTNFHLPRSTLFMLVAPLRARDDAARLCARHRNRLSVLFLRRCVLVVPRARRFISARR